MPGHFTHIYSARRVADHLLSGHFPDWPVPIPELQNYSPQQCGQVMKEWEKYTAIGAIGPDLFYFSQDYNSAPLGPVSDEIMLALKTYYYFDSAKEDDWEPLLIILEHVNSSLAQVLRFLIKLQKIWKEFVEGWNKTIGPIVSSVDDLTDALTGGVLSEFKVVIEQLKLALIAIGEQEILTFKDIFTMFNTCIQKGFDEQSFLWSDMTHYRRPSALCRALVRQSQRLAEEDSADSHTRSRQFLAFALGYITHVGTDVIAHSFVNEQCGGPFRNHPQRHHLIENHIDAWNYSQSHSGKLIPADPWGATDSYPELSMSALWFAVQLTPGDAEQPMGVQRPEPLPEDPAERKKALDVDGDMPGWMADSIILALIDTFIDHPHPQIFGGDGFQAKIDQGKLADVIFKVTGNGMTKPFSELLDGIAPAPGFKVPQGFPLPWQMQAIYKIMITFYKFSYSGTWELQKPRKPDFIITPPASDIENLLQPPDFSGIDGSNPALDVCTAIVALVEWAIKELEAAIKLATDLIKMLASPGSYLIRLGLYELSMMVWDVVMKTHEVLAHTGFFIPHGEQRYGDGELRLPDEIDLPLITLGGTVDSAFRAALEAAIDPLGNLDKDPSVIGVSHSVLDVNYPYYPVLRKHLNSDGTVQRPLEAWEFRRPWAYPSVSLLTTDGKNNITMATPTETYDPSKSDAKAAQGAYKPLRPGPYGIGARPDVFFRLGAPIDTPTRLAYEHAQTPAETDRLNEAHLTGRKVFSPLGDPIPFSAHLISRLTNDTGYSTQYNLDSDRAFAYLTWDWIRRDASDGALTHFNPNANATATTELGFVYRKPVVAPQASLEWNLGNTPLQLRYVDAAPALPPVPPIR